MTKLAFPSEDFPAQPAITLAIPDDWLPVLSPDAVMAARRVAEEGVYMANVVVRIERRPADFEVTDALTELRQVAAERPQAAISEPFKAELDGQQFIGCDLSWVDERVGTVLQAHLFGGVPTGRFLQLVHVTGSAGGAQALKDYPAIKAIMKSLTVGAPVEGVSEA